MVLMQPLLPSAGLPLAWVAAGGGLALLVLDWRDASVLLGRVDYNILVFFPGLFITVAGMCPHVENLHLGRE